ncbi:MAG: tetratricopeptide repeat protein [Candidatus Omnitrophica bacterium]|nr:tetratricopeptide repeat protein [Candidatus Omnitrophota bacterium]
MLRRGLSLGMALGWLAVGALAVVSADEISSQALSPSLPAETEQVQSAPGDEELDFARGLYARGLYAMALEEFEAFMKTHPDHPKAGEALFGKAESIFMTHDYPAALAVYRDYASRFVTGERIETVFSRIAECLYLTDHKAEARTYFLKLQKSSAADTRLTAVYYTAKIDFDAGRYEAARQGMAQAAQGPGRHPLAPYAEYYLGEIAFKEKSYAEALEIFRRAGASGEDEIRQAALLGEGRALFGLGRLDEAAKAFRDCAEMKGDVSVAEDAFLNYLSALFNQGLYSEAAAAC